MVQTNNLLKSGIIGALATAASAQSLFTPIDYKSTLDVYYYFRNSPSVRATVNEDGIGIDGTFGSTSDLCSALSGAQIVYSKDNGEEVLLTADCSAVYHLVDDSSDEITWDSCEEFSFYPSDCPSGDGAVSSSAGYSSLAASQSITDTLSTTGTASYAENSISNGETLYLTTVTSTIDNVETIYTTYCPISEIIASRSNAPITGGTTNIRAQPAETSNADAASAGVFTSTFVSTSSGSVGTFTSLYPITNGATPSGQANQKPGRVYVTNTDYYEVIASQSAVSSSSKGALTTVTETHNGVQTVYTTYCPESSVAPVAPASDASKPAAVAPSSTTVPAETAAAASSTQGEASSPVENTAATSETVIEPQTQATDVSIVSETSAASQPTGNAAPAQSDAVISTKQSASAAQGSGSVSVAQQGSSATATASSPQVSVYEGTANRLINSVSAVSIAAIVFGFFF